MAMEKLPPLSQIIKIAFILLFLLLTPFIPISLRPSYLYFLFNILILVLGIESGFLKAISGPLDEKKSFNFHPHVFVNPISDVYKITNITTSTKVNPTTITSNTSRKSLQIEKLDNSLGGIVSVKKLKKCPSRPAIFFIGGYEAEDGDNEETDNTNKDEEKYEEWMEAEEMTKQELFAKAECFIGNFYRQLKMQRNESWNKIHEIYHKAF